MAQEMADEKGVPFYVFLEKGIVHSVQEGMRDIPANAERFVRQLGMTVSDPSKILRKIDRVLLEAIAGAMKTMSDHTRIMVTSSGAPAMVVVTFEVYWEADLVASAKIAATELEGVLLGLRFGLGFCVHQDYAPKIAVQ